MLLRNQSFKLLICISWLLILSLIPFISLVCTVFFINLSIVAKTSVMSFIIDLIISFDHNLTLTLLNIIQLILLILSYLRFNLRKWWSFSRAMSLFNHIIILLFWFYQSRFTHPWWLRLCLILTNVLIGRLLKITAMLVVYRSYF